MGKLGSFPLSFTNSNIPHPFPTYFPTPFLSYLIYIMDSTSIYTFNDALSLKIRRGVDCRYRTRCIRFKEKGGLSRRTYVTTLCYGRMGYKWGDGQNSTLARDKMRRWGRNTEHTVLNYRRVWGPKERVCMSFHMKPKFK